MDIYCTLALLGSYALLLFSMSERWKGERAKKTALDEVEKARELHNRTRALYDVNAGLLFEDPEASS